MRTLSARILLGFAALTLTFGVITATIVVNMRQVEDQVTLILKGYVRLALESKDLARSQDDLRTYIEEKFTHETSASDANVALNRHRNARDRGLKKTRQILESLEKIVQRRQFAVTRPRLDSVERGVVALEPLYTLVLETPPIGDPTQFDDKHKAAAVALEKLRAEERMVRHLANQLSEQLERSVTTTTHYLEDNQHTLRMRTIYGGTAAVALGLFVTLWVVIALRPLRRLRDAARGISAGDYASRIPEKGPAEVADLAREFNSMGRAVEERERELVRSERLAAVGKMAAMITHEVRNPLSSIGLNTELLEEELGAAATDEARALCRSIHHEVDRLTAITEEYLAFARLPKPKLAPEAVNPMVGALAAFVREDLALKQIKLVTSLAPDDPIAHVDNNQIRQCLINLVRNAADAVGSKGSGTITLRTKRVGKRVEIEVEDDGVGIPAELQGKLFDGFFSTKEGGSGLGLALTQQIVRDHGGELRVASAVGRGTTFTVSVPASG